MQRVCLGEAPLFEKRKENFTRYPQEGPASRFVGKVMTPVVFFPDSTLKGAKIILAISDCQCLSDYLIRKVFTKKSRVLGGIPVLSLADS